MDDTHKLTQILDNEQATRTFAGQLAAALKPGLIIYLQGELGAGKTTLTRELLRQLGYQGRVKSPTYTLVESYPLSSYTVHHFDLYRFNDIHEWEDSGFSELFGTDTLSIIEWPDKAHGVLPAADWIIELTVTGPETRHIGLTAHSTLGKTCLKLLPTTPPVAN